VTYIILLSAGVVIEVHNIIYRIAGPTLKSISVAEMLRALECGGLTTWLPGLRASMLDARATNDIEGLFSFIGVEVETIMLVHGVYTFIFGLNFRFAAYLIYVWWKICIRVTHVISGVYNICISLNLISQNIKIFPTHIA